MPQRVIDAWDWFYHKQKMKRNKKLKVSEKKMKVGDKVVLYVHGAGVVSQEFDYIEEISDEHLKLEDADRIYHKQKDGSYKTDVGFGGFWFKVNKDGK